MSVASSGMTYCAICDRSITNNNWVRHQKSLHSAEVLSAHQNLGNGSASEINAINAHAHEPVHAPHPGALFQFRRPTGIYCFFKWLLICMFGI